MIYYFWMITMSLREKIVSLPRYALIGYFAPLIALLGIITAIALSPNFLWTDNALSDLGHYTRTDLGGPQLVVAIIFNGSLITTAILVMYAVFRLFREFNDQLTKIALGLFFIATIFLMSIGIFSENFGYLHFIVSVGFFLSFPWTMWIIAIRWIKSPSLRMVSVLFIFMPFISILLWLTPLPTEVFGWTGVAIPEISTALTAIIWLWIFIYYKESGKLEVL
ncbi:MAG: DUF998 domain-containing protein [Candidatus Lokiarchaeota archaeon]|nr:DUF998 domain-containing protein [Candidatus Lokiarchaeota archaeon]